MQRQNRNGLALLASLGTFLILSGGAVEYVAAQCGNPIDPGCYYSTNVPCSNAKCAAVSETSQPLICTDGSGNTATAYSATATTAWYKCKTSTNYAAGKCTELMDTCANVTIFTGNDCTQMTVCGSTTFDACLAKYASTKCSN